MSSNPGKNGATTIKQPSRPWSLVARLAVLYTIGATALLRVTMVQLTRGRTARFGRHAAIQRTGGSVRLDLPDGTFDRFISNYVLDLLSEEDMPLF
jgi:hypothetical protein